MRIFDVYRPSGWTYETNSSGTFIRFYNSYIPPGAQRTFEIYSYNTNSVSGTANARADGGGDPLYFPPLQTPVPVKLYKLEVISAHGNPTPGTTNVVKNTVVTQSIETIVEK